MSVRKVILIFLVFASVLLPAAADSDLGSFGITGGYSSNRGFGYMGFNGTYQLLADVTDSTKIGMGLHSDFAFGITKKDTLPLFFASLAGVGFEFRPSVDTSLNLSLGPAVVVEMAEELAAVGIGAGIDFAFSYFFGKEKAVGITVGATAYPQFLVLDDYRDTPFAIAAMGYAALSFRYPAPVTGLALPALAYIIY